MDFLYNNSLIKEEETLKTGAVLSSYILELKNLFQAKGYDNPECFINLPFDDEILKSVQDIKEKKVGSGLEYVFVIGIGGSNLGAKAVYDALFGYSDILEQGRFPKIIFLDTTDAEFQGKLRKFFEKEIKDSHQFLINVISKSGKTAETVQNFDFVLKELDGKFENVYDRVAITTDKDSELWKHGISNNASLLEIPKKIGGRYSVFSNVGIFPLLAVGLDVGEFKQGAIDMTNICLRENILDSPAAISASATYLNYANNKIINDNFFFHPELESLGKWLRQLIAESLGKQGKGITPTVSIGTTDLHSMAQLYLGGPKDKFTTFVWVKAQANELMHSALEGIKSAYVKQGLAFTEIVLEDISPASLGEFMQFKMIDTILLAKLMGVNAFDQPAVELYKEEVKKFKG